MRRAHFEALHPICPRCRIERGQDHPLILAETLREQDDRILEGVLHCTDAACQLEYPIIDGIPLILPNIQTYIGNNLPHLTARDDLSDTLESILGDGAGPDTLFNSTRQHLSSYGWDNYGDLATAVALEDGAQAQAAPGAVKRCLDAGLELLGTATRGPVIDIGCAVGRSSFELAAGSDQLVLGVDTNFSMLRLAQRVLSDGIVRYPQRRVGIVYDRREFTAEFNNSDRVDFWACDGLALPFSTGRFGLAVGLNVLDSVSSPRDLLESISRMLRPAGSAILACPYDWSQSVTPIEAWIGGHSQRGPGHGASESLLRSLLTPDAHPQSVQGLQITNERTDFPWHTRIHDRSSMTYSVHLVTAEARKP